MGNFISTWWSAPDNNASTVQTASWLDKCKEIIIRMQEDREMNRIEREIEILERELNSISSIPLNLIEIS